MQPIREHGNVTPDSFRGEIAGRYAPAVLRRVVRSWPAVARGLESPEAFCAYLESFDRGGEVDVLRMPPSAKGRIFYAENLNGFNFTRERAPLSSVTKAIVKNAKFENPGGVVAQSALIAESIPGFATENVLPLLDAKIQPRIWLGNSVVTPAHFDESNNIACVIAGRRRFTLFPPEQVANLYVGPIGYAPTGTPISLVNFRNPDYGRYPRFKQALEAAFVADLEPGDAIFIPTLWWHHVESLDKCNALVNYWWRDAVGPSDKASSALNVLLLALLDLKHLPREQRDAWRNIFDHYVFNPSSDVADHIPAQKRGVLGAISPELAEQVRAFLAGQLKR
jgi:cupin-like protein